VVAESHDGYAIGYHSVFDHTPSVSYHYFSRNDSLLNRIRTQKETQQLIRLARGFYTLEEHNDTLVFNNLRFGQVNGWENPKAGFIFRYNLEKPNSLFTVQQGRFSGWNRKTTAGFIKRIKGN
jgi:inner membrane protein